MRRLMTATAVSLATLLGVALLWKFRGAAAMFVVSLAAAAALRPLVATLEPRLGRALALAVVYLSGIGLAVMFSYVVTHGFLHELDDGLELLGSAYDQLRTRGSGSSVHGFVLRRLPASAALAGVVEHQGPEAMLAGALGFTLNAMDLAGRFIIVVALSAYWSASQESFERLWLSLLPASSRAAARDTWRSVEDAVGAHIRSEVGQSLLAVLLIGLAFRLAHLPTPMLPALAAGVFRLVPFFGTLVAVAASFLAGAATDVRFGVLAGTYTLLVIVLLDRVLARRLFSARRYSPTLTVFLVVALVDAFGILGVLIASPLAAAIHALVARLIAAHSARRPRRLSLGDIERRLARARQRLPQMPAPEAAQLGSVVDRLDELTAEARRATAATAGSMPVVP